MGSKFPQSYLGSVPWGPEDARPSLTSSSLAKSAIAPRKQRATNAADTAKTQEPSALNDIPRNHFQGQV
jgi:hypothetical protein